MALKYASIVAILFGMQPLWAACVQVRSTPVFNKPSTEGSKTWEATIFTPLKVKKMQGAWVSVSDIDGHAHWIQMTALTKQFQCASVKAKQTTLHRKVNETYEPIADLPILKRTSFKLIAQEKEWLQLEDAQGNSYWGQKKDFWLPVDPKPKSPAKQVAAEETKTPHPEK